MCTWPVCTCTYPKSGVNNSVIWFLTVQWILYLFFIILQNHAVIWIVLHLSIEVHLYLTNIYVVLVLLIVVGRTITYSYTFGLSWIIVSLAIIPHLLYLNKHFVNYSVSWLPKRWFEQASNQNWKLAKLKPSSLRTTTPRRLIDTIRSSNSHYRSLYVTVII